MKINYDSQTEEARIELIPLIDVIFCILTFFLLAALQLTRQQAVNVDLPQAETGTVQMQELKLFVSVDQLGQTYVDKQPVTREQLYQLLLTYKRARPEGLIVLSASKMASYNDVMQVLDLLRSVGGDRVALATIPSSGDLLELPGNQPDNGLGVPNLLVPETGGENAPAPGGTIEGN
ncbi:ExbD/TolR family protein [Laspinema olomoucense]|uniref:ExbD/TolR family protein n=1 Tax=Laspinema olomoucense TaxID=3231600 RepID=UPI0021BB7FA2|nr:MULTISPECIES: biopolymer transporter ExbD [unclassified Laspinema]MCT7989227.1 biopolymer transporter ExbD [Laspinema sp. D3a]MCT7992601.1 biopolymer transporter ExbD [Laspinema sp. D3c]